MYKHDLLKYLLILWYPTLINFKATLNLHITCIDTYAQFTMLNSQSIIYCSLVKIIAKTVQIQSNEPLNW